MKIALIGLGNPYVGDDSIGIKIVEAIQTNYPLSESIDVLPDLSLSGIGLVEVFRGYDKVIIVDAILTKNHQVGEIVVFTPDDLTDTLHTTDFHNMDFFSAVQFAKHLYTDIPEDITLIGIEIEKANEFTYEISNQLKQNYTKIVDQVYSILIKIKDKEIKPNVRIH